MAQKVKNPPAMQEIQFQSPGREDPLEKEMATHSSTLAWEISWTEEHSELQSMGSQRVRHDLASKNEVKKILFQSRYAYSLTGTVLIRALEIQTYLTLTKTLHRYISCLFIYSTKI